MSTQETVFGPRKRLRSWLVVVVAIIVSGGCSSAGGAGVDPALTSSPVPETSADSPTQTTSAIKPVSPRQLPPTDTSAVPVVGRAKLALKNAFGTQYSTVAFGDLWLVGGNKVTRVDPREKEVKASIRMPEFANAQSAIELNGKLWVANNGGGLSVIDPTTNKIVDQPVIEIAPYAMATDGDKLWLTDFENSKVVRYDPTTHKIEVSLDISSPTGLAVIGDAVFVAQHRSEYVVRIDPAAGEVVATYQVGFGPENVVAVTDTAWVASGDGNAIARIGASGDFVTMPVGEAVLAVGANADGGGPVWASLGPRSGCDASNSSVVRIDPSTSRITGRVDVPCAAYAVQIGDDLWVIDDNSEAMYVATISG